jgi:hypothetical protein
MAQMQAMMKQVMLGGKEELTMMFVVVNDQTMLMTYNEELMLDFLKEFPKPGSPFTAEADVETALKLLPAQRQATMLVSLTGYYNFTMNLVRALILAQGPGAAELMQVPDFPSAPPVAMAVNTAGNRVETSAVVPHELLTAASAYVQNMVQLNAAPGGF